MKGAGTRARDRPHLVNMASKRRGGVWLTSCSICGVGLVNKPRAGEPDKVFAGHAGRSDLDVESAEPGLPSRPIPLIYCCVTLGWVPPDIAFEHRWDGSRVPDDARS